MLETQVKNYMEKENLVHKGEKVLVGFSGGADSLALLILLDRLKEEFAIEIGAAHLNHDLRGEASDEDENFCKNFCLERQIPFYSQKISIEAYAQDQKISVELAGRKKRYAFFKEIMVQEKYEICATAHHLDDQAETMLLNLMRGTGLSGLAAMQPQRENFIKPLLFLHKEELLRYLADQGVSSREDETNEENLYQRNKVRNQLIPYIKENFNDNIEETLWRMGRLIQTDLDYLDLKVQEVGAMGLEYNELKKQVTLKKEVLKEHDAILSRLILKAIEMVKHDLKDIEEIHVKQVMALSRNDTGKNIHLKAGIMVRNNYGELIFKKNEEHKSEEPLNIWLDIPGEYQVKGQRITLRVIQREDIKKDVHLRFFNGDVLDQRVFVRHRLDGDTMRPLGMGGYKKIKNILMDKKVDREKRDQLLIFQNRKDIFYIGGMMISEDYKVKESTKKIVEIGIFKEDGQ